MYAVLTGDIVKSSGLTGDEMQRVMKRLEVEVAKLPGVKAARDFSVFRGDGWQLLLRKPSTALRTALSIRTALIMESGRKKRFDTKIAIGVGGVDNLDPSSVTRSTGIAFTSSGKALETLDDRRRMAFSGRILQAQCLQNAVLPLLDEMIISLTVKQSMALYGALSGLSHQQIADIIFEQKITRQSVSQHLHKAHWQSIRSVLDFYENIKNWRGKS